MRAGQKVLLVHGLQDHCDRSLEELVLEGRDPDRPSLATVAFRDVDPLHGRHSVAARLQATQQLVQIFIQVRSVVAARLAIHSGRSVLPGASVGFAEEIRVDVVGVNAESGKVKWVNDTSGTLNDPTASTGAYTISGVGPTGYLLAGNGALAVPTGRSFPASYALGDGRLLKSVAPSYQNKRGGPITCIDRHGSILFGYPRERLTGRDYSLYYVYQLPTLQQHGVLRADRIIVDKEAYLTVNDRIRCATFRNSRYTSPKIVVHWEADCPGKSVHCMALAAKSLLLGVDNAVVVRDRKTGDILWQEDDLDGHVQSLAVVDDRILAATDAGSIYCFAANSNATPVQQVKSPLTVVKPMGEGLSQVLKDARIRRGLALVVGMQDTTLALQLAAKTQLEVLLLLDDPEAMQTARHDLLGQTNPGQGKVTVQQHIRGAPLPYADYAFNMIATTGEVVSARAAELLRVLRPVGGILYVDKVTADVAKQVETDLPEGGVTTNRLRRVGKASFCILLKCIICNTKKSCCRLNRQCIIYCPLYLTLWNWFTTKWIFLLWSILIFPKFIHLCHFSLSFRWASISTSIWSPFKFFISISSW